jgi:HPt (histidine-containing phosphotransfer) domain-containing protein
MKYRISKETLDSLRELQSESDPDFLLSFMNIVREAMRVKVPLIGQAIQNGDVARMRSEAHALKSSCLNAGFELMGDLCNEIEFLGKSGVLTGADRLFDELRKEHSLVEEEIALLPEFKGAT